MAAFTRRILDRRLKPYVEMLVRIESQKSRDELQRSLTDMLEVSPAIWGKMLPQDIDSDELVVRGREPGAPVADDGYPAPPSGRWEIDGYASGERHVETMRAALEAAGCSVESCGPILDFGCGTARMLRCLAAVAEHTPVWGVDIQAESMAWCQAHLSPPFHFMTTTTLPSLPFEDRTFGLVYAGSVFTHISELAETWVHELKRITRPGGHLYLTFQDQPYLEAMLAGGGDHWTAQLARRSEALLSQLGPEVPMISIGRASKNAMVYYDRDTLVERWGRILEVVDVVDCAFDYQSAIVLRRRET